LPSLIDLTRRDILQIEGLASLGFTIPEIATALGFSERTFYYKKSTDDAVFAAWERGKLKGKGVGVAVVFRNMVDGDQRAAEYYLGTVHGMTPKSGEVGAASDRTDEQERALADPHDELLRRYEEIALRQAEEASVMADLERDLEPQDRPSTASEDHDDTQAA
jgi:hypothetical protein